LHSPVGAAEGCDFLRLARLVFQPFLLLFFLIYLAIGLLFARRRLLEKNHAPKPAPTGTAL